MCEILSEVEPPPDCRNVYIDQGSRYPSQGAFLTLGSLQDGSLYSPRGEEGSVHLMIQIGLHPSHPYPPSRSVLWKN